MLPFFLLPAALGQSRYKPKVQQDLDLYNTMIQQKKDIQQFSQIISPEAINLQLFHKACEDNDADNLAEFILSMEKILKLYDKPGRSNPFLKLTSSNLVLVIDKLKSLEEKLKLSIYEIKVRKILQKLERFLNGPKVLLKPKEEDEQIKKIVPMLKFEQILANPQILQGKFSHPRTLYKFLLKQILPQVGRFILSINDHDRRYEAVQRGLNLCNCIIHPTEIEVQISKNTLLQSRVFRLNYQFDFQSNQVEFLKQAASIINEGLLCPSDIKIQGLLLKILKRMYMLWGEIVHGPLFLNLRNISIFFSEEPATIKTIKEAAIFCYSVINSKSDIKFADILQSSQDLSDLKRNQFFSSKGLALPFEIGCNYDTLNLSLPLWSYKIHLEKREKHVLPIIIQKSNTLLNWKFQIPNHDISFGLYKVRGLKNYQIEEYDKSQQCKSVVKLSKYGQGTPNNKMPVKGQTFLKTGLYHMIFDNSHSIVRGKDIIVEVSQLETIS